MSTLIIMTETEVLFNTTLTYGDMAEMYQYTQLGLTVQDFMRQKAINMGHDVSEAERKKAEAEANKSERDKLIQSQKETADDQLTGGIRHFLNKAAVQSPQVDVKQNVELQRQVNAIKNQMMVNHIEEGTINTYRKMDNQRRKLRRNGYRQQARINYRPQTADTFEGVYNGLFGTAGLPTNQPDKINTFQDRTINVNRGRINEYIPNTNAPYLDFY